MAETTIRDRVWLLIFAALRKGRPVNVRRIAEPAECSPQVARSALEAAATNGLFREETGADGRAVFRPAVEISDVDELEATL